MTRKSILVLAVSVLSIVGVSLWGQTRRDPTAVTSVPGVLSGENIGIRLTGPADRSGKVPGTLVVRINGKWVDVVSTPTVIGAGR
jgi:hypothetical protein